MQNTLPNAIIHLMFGEKYNQYIHQGVIPNSVRYSEFGYKFNQYISHNVISDGVIYLKFGDKFNQYISPKSLPDSIKYLEFGDNFDQIIMPDSIPKYIKYLKFASCYIGIITPNALPITLDNLMLGIVLNYSTEIIPNNITKLTLNNKIIGIGNYMKKITHLSFGDNYIYNVTREDIPNSVKYLKFGANIFDIEYIPNSVQHLSFFCKYIRPCLVPDSVTYLYLCDIFRAFESLGNIPDSVTHLTLCEDIKFIHKIPKYVKHLIIHYKTLLLVPEFPNTIEYLTFNCYCDEEKTLVESGKKMESIIGSLHNLREINCCISYCNIILHNTMKLYNGDFDINFYIYGHNSNIYKYLKDMITKDSDKIFDEYHIGSAYNDYVNGDIKVVKIPFVPKKFMPIYDKTKSSNNI